AAVMDFVLEVPDHADLAPVDPQSTSPPSELRCFDSLGRADEQPVPGFAGNPANDRRLHRPRLARRKGRIRDFDHSCLHAFLLTIWSIVMFLVCSHSGV